MTTSQASRIFGIPYNSLLMYVRGKYGKSLKLDQLKQTTPAANDTLNTIGNSRSTPKEKLKQQKTKQLPQTSMKASSKAARLAQQQHQDQLRAVAAAAATFGPAALLHAGLPHSLLQEHMVAAAAAAASANNGLQQLPQPPHPDGSRMRELINNLHREQQGGDDHEASVAVTNATAAAMAAAKSSPGLLIPSPSRSSPVTSSVGSLEDMSRQEMNASEMAEDEDEHMDQEMRVQELLLRATQNSIMQLTSTPDDEDINNGDAEDMDGDEDVAATEDEQNNNPEQEPLEEEEASGKGSSAPCDMDHHVEEVEPEENDDLPGRQPLDVLPMSSSGGEISAL